MNDDYLIRLPEDCTSEDIDSAVAIVAKLLKEDDKAPQVIIPQKTIEFNYVYRLLRSFFDNTTEITYTIHKPLKSDGNISVTGDELVINKSLLNNVMGFVDIIEVLPTRDGRVKMNFSFSGLTRKVCFDE